MEYEMQTASSLDWVTATRPNTQYPEMIIPQNRIEMGEKINAPRWFDVAYKLEPAGIFAAQEDGNKTAMLRLTGKDIAAWRKAGWTDYNIIQFFLIQGCNFTRLDFAVDVLGGGDVQDCVDLRDHDLSQGTTRTMLEIKDAQGAGHTAYFGSRQSEQFVRVYDKAAEQKLLQEAWTRVELQARKKTATALANDMYRESVQTVGKQRIRQLVHFPTLEWWLDALAGDTVDLTALPRAETNTLRWLREQVAPVFSKKRD